MRKTIIILSLCAIGGIMASCSTIIKNDPWATQHHKARNKVIFPVG